jgi:hypothetical protein
LERIPHVSAPPRPWLRWLALALAMLLCMAAGFALGRYLDDILGWVAHVAPGSRMLPPVDKP